MPDFQWSSPLRRDGTRILEPIPLEIYHEIFEYFHENDDMAAREVRHNLANLTLVCRFFSSITLPRIFDKMVFSGFSDDQTPSTSRFCRAVLNNQEPAAALAQYVKTCTFNSWHEQTHGDDGTARTRDAFFSMYCDALGKMIHVEALEFNFVPVDRRVIKAMKKLPRLNSLRFSRCSFTNTLDVDDLRTLAQALHLKSFIIFDCIYNHMIRDAFTFTLSFRLLKLLEVDDWVIVKHLVQYDNPLPLQTLILHNVKDHSLLPTLLQRTPELLRLCIYRIDVSPMGSTLDSITIPASTVPKLSLFDGPPALATALIPTRPTSKIRLLGTLMTSSMYGELSLPLSLPPLDHQLWEALGRSASPIQEIAIPKHLYAVDNFKTYLPEVLTLKISWCHGNWGNDLFFPGDAKDVENVVSHLCRLWPPNPSVRRLVFDFTIGAEAKAPYLDLQSQSQIIQKEIVVAFPKVERINFLTCINWQRSSLDGLWRANVPKPKRRYLLGTWEEIRDKLVDYDGCFAAVFKREN